MVREDLIEHFGVKQDKVIAIYNPCYIETIKDKIQGEKLPDDDEQFFINNKGNIVLTAGRLVDQKGQWHLIRAFSRVINKMPDANLRDMGEQLYLYAQKKFSLPEVAKRYGLIYSELEN